MIDLSAETEVKVLFFVAGGHYVSDFRIGKEGEIGFQVFIGTDIVVECRDTHVETEVVGEGEAHGFVGEADIGEGRVEGMVFSELIEVVGVEGRCVEVLVLCECNGVEVCWIEGHQGGVSAWVFS